MRIIVCGAGNVGFSIAQYLADGYDVVLVDSSEEVLKEKAEDLDVKMVLGNASDPEVLEQAEAHKARAIIAVTERDETNIVTCQVAKAIFNVPLKIARLKNVYEKRGRSTQDIYWPIDVIISPEGEVAADILRHINASFASQILPIANNKAILLGLTIHARSLFVESTLPQIEKLIHPLEARVVRLKRDQETFIPSATTVLKENDIAYFLLPFEQFNDFVRTAGYTTTNKRRFLILGGTQVSINLAEEIKSIYPDSICSIITYQHAEIDKLSRLQAKCNIFHGDALAPSLLEEVGVSKTDVIVAVTTDDKVNILASLLAKRYGAKIAVTIVNRQDYISLMESLGIDKAVNLSSMTISLILKHIRKRPAINIHTIGKGFPEEILEVDVKNSSRVLGLALKEINDTKEMWIAALIRAGELIFADESSVLQEGDKALILTSPHASKKIEKYF